jgi:hypothetical protein
MLRVKKVCGTLAWKKSLQTTDSEREETLNFFSTHDYYCTYIPVKKTNNA